MIETLNVFFEARQSAFEQRNFASSVDNGDGYSYLVGL